jgi:hypothetical protein
LLPTLTDEKLTLVLCELFTHEASKILDTAYIPSMEQSKDLFIEKQKYVYVVLRAYKDITDRVRATV